MLSGGNIDVSFIHKIVEKGLVTRGRQMKFSTVMPDIPGSLRHFSTIVADCGANIIMVQHDRLHTGLNLNEAILHIACEVGGPEHAQTLIQNLEAGGYRITMEGGAKECPAPRRESVEFANPRKKIIGMEAAGAPRCNLSREKGSR